MGAFLFYLFKSTLCLLVFYVVFRLGFRGDTLFRTNRFLLLAGSMGCLLLPWVQVNVLQGNVWQKPLIMVETLLTDMSVEETPVRGEGEMEPALPSEAEAGVAADGVGQNADLVYVLWVLYVGGAVLVSGIFMLSLVRMRQLLHRCEVGECDGFRLLICPHRQQSFSWGRTIVLSQEDYERNYEAVLLHERMHLRYWHTADLLWMELFVVLHWFNPAAWLLMRELREIHEFEADRGVLSQGIDATQYQLLLVKKSVGIRLYSMAIGFRHSKLKQRINMMLKKRTNGLARLKLLLFVPVVSGALYVFARPEMENAGKLLAKPQVDEQVQDTFRQDELELLEQYFTRKFREGGGETVAVPEKVAHLLLVNLVNRTMVDDAVAPGTTTEENVDFIRERLADVLRNDYQLARQQGRPFRSCLQVRYDHGASVEAVRLYLQTVKEVYGQLRKEVSAEQGISDEAALDKVFPVLVTFEEPKMSKRIAVSPSEKLPMEIGLFAPGKSVMLKNFSLNELRDGLRALQSEQLDRVTVSLKVNRDVPMAVVRCVKTVLREEHAAGVEYAGDGSRVKEVLHD